MAKYRKIRYRDDGGRTQCIEHPAHKVKDDGDVVKIESEDSVQEIPRDRIVEDAAYYDDCFISTAAYGTPSAEKLDTLRNFRDEVMTTNLAGKLLLEYYHRISPSIADEIADNENIKKKLRGMLEFSVSMIEKRENSAGTSKAFYSVTAVVGYIIMCLAAKILVDRKWNRFLNLSAFINKPAGRANNPK